MDHTISALLEFKGIGKAIAWYKKVLGAEENMRIENAKGKVTYAELVIGDSMIFLKDNDSQFPELTYNRPTDFHVHIRRVDKTINTALQNDAMLIVPAMDQDYGDRSGCIRDPFGYSWYLTSDARNIYHKGMGNRKGGFAA